MKTRNFWIFGVLLAAIVILSSNSITKAQNTFTQSDTVTLGWDSSRFTLRNFDTVAIGNTQCHTIYFKNTGSSPLIINTIFEFDGNGGHGSFTANTIPPLPLILLQNEIVSIADLCFSPTDNTSYVDQGALAIRGTIGSAILDIDVRAFGFQKPDTLLSKPCFTATIDTDFFGPIIMDGDVSHTVTIESNRNDSLWLVPDSLKTLKPPFSYSGITSPYHLAPREIKTFTITYSPRSNQQTVQYRSVGSFNITEFNYCNYYTFSLPGVAIPPTADSISTALAAGSTDILAMIGDNSITTKTFHFKNTGTTNLKITGVALKNGKSFAITNITPSNTLPFTLAPGASMSVTVAMTTVSNGVYYDEVIITAEQGIISMDFQLQGLRKNGVLAVHNTLPASQHVTLYPNPTHGNITIAIPGIRNAKIEVLDILGKVITTATASEMWNWNASAPAGTYVVHVSGTDESGKTFRSYDRFIIEK